MNTCPISVVIPTYNRDEDLIQALRHIQDCCPRPDEIIVHIDHGDQTTPAILAENELVDVILTSPSQMGPGGGRNRAIAQAKNEIVASFDDDSYPLDKDYFTRLIQLFDQFPSAAVIGAAIYHKNEPIESDRLTAQWEHSFIGCGCAYRKSVFQKMRGYVPIPVAYGMEEVDLSLRLHAAGWGILISPWLRVFHNTELSHHSSAKVTAASISNQILLAYLRYPPSLWWIGIGQCFSRVVWLLKHNRRAGILRGLKRIPQDIRSYHAARQTISTDSLRSFLALKRHVIAVSIDPFLS